MNSFSLPAHARLSTTDAQNDGDKDPPKQASDDKTATTGKETDIAEQSLTIPKSVEHGIQILDQCHFDNVHCKLSLKSLNIVGAQNAKLATKRKLLATKMVQRKVSLSTICKLIDGCGDTSSLDCAFFNGLRNTTVRIKRNARDHEEVIWVKGDIPVFVDGEIVIGEPPLGAERSASVSQLQRRPPFEAVEFYRLLHVLVDARMVSVREKFMDCMKRVELDKQREDPWSEAIAPLFNDPDFRPEPISVVSGGVTRDDICSINPANRSHLRDGGILKPKFAEFKSLYGTCVTRYEASGQGDPEAFVSYADGKIYIMYAFCFLHLHPIMEPLCTRALRSNFKQEAGVVVEVSQYGFGSPAVSQSRSKRARPDNSRINSSGLESLAAALTPHDEHVAREMEKAERDKVRFEAVEAHARSTKATLEAILKVKDMLTNISCEQEKKVLHGSSERLMRNLDG